MNKLKESWGKVRFPRIRNRTERKSEKTDETIVPSRLLRFGRACLKGENLLLILTIIGVALGIAVGVGIKFSVKADPTFTPRQVIYLQFPGTLFLRMLKCVILPLITSSLISSITSLDMKTAGRIGALAALYYFTTTVLAVITGIVLVVTIKPGSYATAIPGMTEESSTCQGAQPSDTILDLLRNMFPNNILEAGFQAEISCVQYQKRLLNGTFMKVSYRDAKALTQREQALMLDDPYQVTKSGMNILGLVTFSLVFGFIINSMGEDGLPLAKFFRSLEGAMMKIITLIIWLSPIGIMFLIAGQIVAMDNLQEELKRLGMYIVTVLVGLGIHGIITLPLLLFILGRRNPLKYAYNMLQAYLTALGTSSSSATMPITYKCLEEHNSIDKRVTRFMIPLGATVNMDGTALYEAVAAIYIAQTIGQSMNVGQIILISLTATLASIGAAGIPGAGLITMLMVLIAVGLPAEMYSLIVPVDWFLDRIRTMVNVHGDSVGTAIVQRFCQTQLDKSKRSNDIKIDDDHLFNTTIQMSHVRGDKGKMLISATSLPELRERLSPEGGESEKDLSHSTSVERLNTEQELIARGDGSIRILVARL